MNELAGLDVLILRSSRTDDPLPAVLSAKGASVHCLPVQKITVFDQPNWLTEGPVTEHRGSSNYHKAVFVSRRAASLALSLPGGICDVLEGVDECFAVGPTTASVLKAQGLQVACPDKDWNSEGLLALAPLSRVEGERIIIFRGRGGRELLGQVLRERGAQVDYCELYQRQLDISNRQEIIDRLQPGSRCVLLAHSAEILSDLLAVLGPEHKPQALETPLVVPGERLAKRGRLQGFKRVVVAENALADALEGALLDWYTPA